MSNRPTVCGVQVHTWGARYRGGSGLWSYLNTKLYGNSLGHAAIVLTIPANNKSAALIKKYCIDASGKKIIPYRMRTVIFADGKTTEAVYEVYFSVLPGYEDPIYLENNIDKDKRNRPLNYML